jgi:hypothetical protein
MFCVGDEGSPQIMEDEPSSNRLGLGFRVRVARRIKHGFARHLIDDRFHLA